MRYHAETRKQENKNRAFKNIIHDCSSFTSSIPLLFNFSSLLTRMPNFSATCGGKNLPPTKCLPWKPFAHSLGAVILTNTSGTNWNILLSWCCDICCSLWLCDGSSKQEGLSSTFHPLGTSMEIICVFVFVLFVFVFVLLPVSISCVVCIFAMVLRIDAKGSRGSPLKLNPKIASTMAW